MELSQIPNDGKWQDIAEAANGNFNKVSQAVDEGIEQAAKSAAYASGYLNTIQQEIASMQTLPTTDPAIVTRIATNATNISEAKSDINDISAALESVQTTTTTMILEQGTIGGTTDADGVQASRVRTKGHFVANATTIKFKVTGKNGVNAVIAQVVFVKPSGAVSYNIPTSAAEITYGSIEVGTKIRLVFKDADNVDATQTASNYQVNLADCVGVTAEDGAAISVTTASYKECATKEDIADIEDDVDEIADAIGSNTTTTKSVALVQGSISGTTAEDLAQTNRVRTKGELVTTSQRFTIRINGENGVDAVIASVVFTSPSGKVSYVIETGKELSYIKDVGTKVRCIFKDNSDNASVQDPSNYELLISECSGVDATSNYTTQTITKYNDIATQDELATTEANIYKNVYAVFRNMIADDFIKGDKPLKILFLGNSFSVQSVQFLTQLFAANNLKYVIGVSYVGGGGIDTYNTNINNASYTCAYHKNSGSGWVDVTNNTKQKITDEKWDYICVQQNSSAADSYSTYGNIGSLISKIKAVATNPLVKIAYFATWGWSDTKLAGTAPTDKPSNATSTNMQTMYNNIVSAVNSMMTDFGSGIDLLFKCGTAMYNQLDYYSQNQLYYSGGTQVQTSLSVGGNDGQHPNIEGVYAATLLIFRKLIKDFGQVDIDVTYNSTLGVTQTLFNRAKSSSENL